ncbi:major facilitator superfamily-domain-containing protein [Mycena belliarum]|uniref:Major facilitator superfamily-domain-containing protein n=1 Tax=Mycena belliarum TaxID=1033014 RepID=A0AAD6UMY1_9AGAR|nr:major facilitator superfamily-domain-containing protein [Mycena belliae]
MSSSSWTEETQVTDPFVAVFTSPSRSRSIIQHATDNASPHSLHRPAASPVSGEQQHLLGHATAKKPFYRARPLWLVPFAITAALTRGMTIAPRIEVFTQLSCSRLHHSYNHTTAAWAEPTSVIPPLAPVYLGLDALGPQFIPERNDAPTFLARTEDEPWDDDETGGDDPRRIPSARCMSDAAVQAGAARIQTMFTIIMGLLSAFTTGWWGQFGERHGRTKVLAIATVGLFLTDLIFILASTPSSPLSSHGHKLLLVAPVIEGLLGGWSTLQSAMSAYISDCTSSGSRAAVFSKFTGVSFLGFGFGPLIGAWLIRHPIAFLTSPPPPGQPQAQSVSSVFWVAVFCSFINLFLVLFVFPESVTKEQRDLASGKGKGKGKARAGPSTLEDVAEEREAGKESAGIMKRLLRPLAIFLPVPIFVEGSTRKRKDWSLTLLACAMFGYMLSTGVYAIKYLYAGHVYGWAAETLGYYISLLGTSRSFFLLFAFPLIISTFKPKSKEPKPQGGTKATRPKPTKAHIAREIQFDLGLSRLSLCIDIVGNLAIVFLPSPEYRMHAQMRDQLAAAGSQFQESQVLFVLASWAQCLGAGIAPAMQSLALCIMQARALLAAEAGQPPVDTGTGALFGALAVLQASGQMVLGPLLFGLVYSGTVAAFPKAVFVTAVGILFASLTALVLLRSPLAEGKGKGRGAGAARRRRRASAEEEEETRGRSRVSKDLRGYGSTSGARPQQGAGQNQASSSGASGSV